DGKPIMTGRRSAPQTNVAASESQSVERATADGVTLSRSDALTATGKNLVKLLLLAWCCLCCALDLRAAGRKVMVLGIDGMDPKLLQTFVEQGRMPNFKALMAEGDFRP